MEVVALDFLEMEGHVFDRFGDGERDTYQIDYRRIVGDMEPARPRISTRDGEPPHPYPTYALPMQHGHGHETAAQRYSATRIQAGYEPERSVTTLHIHSKAVPFFLFSDCLVTPAATEMFSLSCSIGCVLLQACLSATWAANQILLPAVLPSYVYRKSFHRQGRIPFVSISCLHSNICNRIWQQHVCKKQRSGKRQAKQHADYAE